MEQFQFNPVNGFEDSASFPDPGSEADAREQLMRLHKQMQAYVNEMSTLVTTIAAGQQVPGALDDLVARLDSVADLLEISDKVVFMGDDE